MEAAIGAAVIARYRLHPAVERRDEAVGPCWRPGLVYAHAAHAAVLQRFEEAVRGRQGGGDPVAAVDLAHHVGSVLRLLQYELHETVERCKKREHEATGCRDDACRIGRKATQHFSYAAARNRHGGEAMAPAFADDQTLVCGIDGNTIGEGEATREFASITGLHVDLPQRARGVAVHEVAHPLAWPEVVGAIGDVEFAAIEGQRGDTVEARDYPAADLQAAVVKADGECAVIRDSDCRDIRRAGFQNGMVVANPADFAVAGIDGRAVQHGEVVGRQCGGDDLAVIEGGVGPERAIHRRNGDGLAAEQVEDSIEEAHDSAPQ